MPWIEHSGVSNYPKILKNPLIILEILSWKSKHLSFSSSLSRICDSEVCSMMGGGVQTKSRGCRAARLCTINCYLSTTLSYHVLSPLFILLLYCCGSFQGSLKVDFCLIPPVHGIWWSLHPICLFTYPIYQPYHYLLEYHIIPFLNIIFDGKQYWILHSIISVWVYPTGV